MPTNSPWRKRVAILVLLAGVLALGASSQLGPTDVTLHLAVRSVPAEDVRALGLEVREPSGEVLRTMRLTFDAARPMPADLWHPTRLPRGKLEVFVRIERKAGPATEHRVGIQVTGSGDAPRVEL